MDPLDRAWPYIISTFREVAGRQPTFDEQADLLAAFREGQDMLTAAEELADACLCLGKEDFGVDRLAGISWEEEPC